MKQKKWYVSKTLWFNLLSGLVLMAQGLTSVHYIPSDILTTVIVCGNFVLRFLTDSAVR